MQIVVLYRAPEPTTRDAIKRSRSDRSRYHREAGSRRRGEEKEPKREEREKGGHEKDVPREVERGGGGQFETCGAAHGTFVKNRVITLI